MKNFINCHINLRSIAEKNCSKAPLLYLLGMEYQPKGAYWWEKSRVFLNYSKAKDLLSRGGLLLGDRGKGRISRGAAERGAQGGDGGGGKALAGAEGGRRETIKFSAVGSHRNEKRREGRASNLGGE